MKTKEFIQKVEELGYLINDCYVYWQIINKENSVVAIVDKNVLFKFSTDFNDWDYILDDDKDKLLSLIVEFASTPNEDREKEEKFLIQHKYLVSKSFYPVCMTWHKLKDVYRPINCRVDNHIYKAQFTLKEVEDIKIKLNTDLADFELIEVGE